jgi:hypothetical protein
MKMRGAPIVTAFATAIVTAIMTIIPVPASAEVVTVCGTTADASRNGPATIFSGPLQRLGGRAEPEVESLIALWRDDQGFDILLQWGESGQHSLRNDGAQIVGMSPDLAFVHLLVAHEGALEHFLFNLDAQGSGELVRSGVDDAAGAGLGDAPAACVKPH